MDPLSLSIACASVTGAVSAIAPLVQKWRRERKRVIELQKIDLELLLGEIEQIQAPESKGGSVVVGQRHKMALEDLKSTLNVLLSEKTSGTTGAGHERRE